MVEGTSANARKIPKIYAHRGASHDFSEHTRLAYEAAVAQSADGFECDVRLTKDGIAILWHDADMARMTDSEFLGTIADLTFDEIRLHYAHVMKLSELIEYAIQTQRDLAIETKHPVPTGHEIEREVLRLLDLYSHKIVSAGIKVSLMSFSWFALEYAKRARIGVPIETVMLLNRFNVRLARRFTSADALGPGINLFKSKTASFISGHLHQPRLFIWTVDQSDDFSYCADAGVEVVITNKPELARKVLGYP